MEIIVKEAGTPLVFSLVGRLDTNTSPQLDKYASDLHKKGVVDLVVDMSECVFVSSAGLRVIVASPIDPMPVPMEVIHPIQS